MGSGARRAGRRRGCPEGARKPSDSSIHLQHPQKGVWKTGRELQYQGGYMLGRDGVGLEGEEDRRQGEREELVDVIKRTIALVFSSAPE